jgi:hypothetical protein
MLFPLSSSQGAAVGVTRGTFCTGERTNNQSTPVMLLKNETHIGPISYRRAIVYKIFRHIRPSQSDCNASLQKALDKCTFLIINHVDVRSAVAINTSIGVTVVCTSESLFCIKWIALIQ